MKIYWPWKNILKYLANKVENTHKTDSGLYTLVFFLKEI